MLVVRKNLCRKTTASSLYVQSTAAAAAAAAAAGGRCSTSKPLRASDQVFACLKRRRVPKSRIVSRYSLR